MGKRKKSARKRKYVPPATMSSDFAPVRFERSILMGDARRAPVDAFVVALACWFNDAKAYTGLAALSERKLRRMFQPNEVLGFKAMHVGLSNHRHAVRLVCSHIEELVELIKHNLQLTADEHFQDSVENLPAPLRHWWDACVGLGSRGSQSKKLRSLFQRVRSNGTFHYYQLNHFKRGYADYYLRTKEREAFLYFGNTLERTHFVFADRSHEAMMEKLTERISNEELIRLTHGLCHAVRLIVVRYLDNHGAALFEDFEME